MSQAFQPFPHDVFQNKTGFKQQRKFECLEAPSCCINSKQSSVYLYVRWKDFFLGVYVQSKNIFTYFLSTGFSSKVLWELLPASPVSAFTMKREYIPNNLHKCIICFSSLMAKRWQYLFLKIACSGVLSACRLVLHS